MQIRTFLLSMLFVFFVGSNFGWAQHEVRTLSNETHKGAVVSITPQEIHVKGANGKVTKVLISQVLSVDLRPAKSVPEGTDYTLVQLYDDSTLFCKTVQFSRKKLTVEMLSGQKVSLPLESVTGLLRDAQDKKLRKEFDALLKKVTKNDRVLVLRSGQLNPIPGALGDVSPDGATVQFKIAGGNIIDAKVAKLKGVIWHRIKAPSKAPVCLVVDTMGNSLAAQSVAVKDDSFIVTIPTGDKITFAETSLAKLDYNRGKLTFLSRMLPAAVEKRSAGNVIEGVLFRENLNLEGLPIMVGKTRYNQGLAMHSHCEVEYKLDGKFKQFKADLGVDARITAESRAIVVVHCDGIQVFRQQVQMGKSIPVNLNIRNVNRLRIIVTSPDDGSLLSLLNYGDRATLANARVIQ